MENIDDVPLSVMDWRTRAAKRVFHATFAAESQAGVDTVGIAKYLRAYWCDVMFGFADWMDVTEYGEEQSPIILYTDCKSLYDHLRKDGAVPDDKWIAVAIASLKCAVSAGPGRNQTKSECRWIASRWQLADCLTKPGLGKVLRGILQAGVTRLHELSLAQVRKAKSGKSVVQGVHYVGCVCVPGDDDDDDEDRIEDLIEDRTLTLPTFFSSMTLSSDARWPLQATWTSCSSWEAGCSLAYGQTNQTPPDLTATTTTTTNPPTGKILRDPLCSSCLLYTSPSPRD